ncbi:hypothetical protein Taro_037133 [Colocasia esculenta]|uniref:Uncharacterized protein n=1 Tax=Colocasia esculenta TaxID=4460 RepID=A0A843WIB1_COLES|nr:hypothetical protein [Colocasia esculenta]
MLFMNATGYPVAIQGKSRPGALSGPEEELPNVLITAGVWTYGAWHGTDMCARYVLITSMAAEQAQARNMQQTLQNLTQAILQATLGGELEMEKNSEVKRAQLGVVPGWVTFLGSLPTDTVVGPVCWLGRHKWYQSLTQPEVQELSATQDKVLRYGSHLLKP